MKYDENGEILDQILNGRTIRQFVDEEIRGIYKNPEQEPSLYEKTLHRYKIQKIIQGKIDKEKQKDIVKILKPSKNLLNPKNNNNKSNLFSKLNSKKILNAQSEIKKQDLNNDNEKSDKFSNISPISHRNSSQISNLSPKKVHNKDRKDSLEMLEFEIAYKLMNPPETDSEEEREIQKFQKSLQEMQKQRNALLGINLYSNKNSNKNSPKNQETLQESVQKKQQQNLDTSLYDKAVKLVGNKEKVEKSMKQKLEKQKYFTQKLQNKTDTDIQEADLISNKSQIPINELELEEQFEIEMQNQTLEDQAQGPQTQNFLKNSNKGQILMIQGRQKSLSFDKIEEIQNKNIKAAKTVSPASNLQQIQSKKSNLVNNKTFRKTSTKKLRFHDSPSESPNQVSSSNLVVQKEQNQNINKLKQENDDLSEYNFNFLKNSQMILEDIETIQHLEYVNASVKPENQQKKISNSNKELDPEQSSEMKPFIDQVDSEFLEEDSEISQNEQIQSKIKNENEMNQKSFHEKILYMQSEVHPINLTQQTSSNYSNNTSVKKSDLNSELRDQIELQDEIVLKEKELDKMIEKGQNFKQSIKNSINQNNQQMQNPQEIANQIVQELIKIFSSNNFFTPQFSNLQSNQQFQNQNQVHNLNLNVNPNQNMTNNPKNATNSSLETLSNKQNDTFGFTPTFKSKLQPKIFRSIQSSSPDFNSNYQNFNNNINNNIPSTYKQQTFKNHLNDKSEMSSQNSQQLQSQTNNNNSYNNNNNDKNSQENKQQFSKQLTFNANPSHTQHFSFINSNSKNKNNNNNSNYQSSPKNNNYNNNNNNNNNNISNFHENFFLKKNGSEQQQQQQQQLLQQVSQLKSQKTANFNKQNSGISALELQNQVLLALEENQINKAFEISLSQDDDIYLIRLMTLTGPCYNKLTRDTTINLNKRLNGIMMSNFTKQIGTNLFYQAQQMGLHQQFTREENLKQLNTLYQLSNTTNQQIGASATQLYKNLNNYLS
ncbi:hypothetical protein PPERSA_08795 [Pseudocohnilembus persalinus]|uniref:Uncharacterized protein n=1 Tax=Pseudocohnilembus persalinus TaxID=266149 RepID=A0A0V0R7L2_PSEPJ|nr:hypothetical protein PPERSA_08795 [Pseudocohnilembus persalinus]|eukprot:KRX10493.1 hypothetical protein PPERSA_08795 [Pseudocohnilembus persalinus]